MDLNTLQDLAAQLILILHIIQKLKPIMVLFFIQNNLSLPRSQKREINKYYYSFKLFPLLGLAKSTRLIYHNQLLMTKFGRILRLMNR